MTLSLANLSSSPQKSKKRIGRGHGSGRGIYSGRGQKGQRARSGGRKNLKRRGLKQFLQQLPKSRGFKSIYPQHGVVNLVDLENKFKGGELVTPEKIYQSGLLKIIYPGVKILGHGKLSKKLTVHAQQFSKSAENAIKKAGGQAIVIRSTKK